MTQTRWTDVDEYFGSTLLRPDPVLTAALADMDAAGMPPHSVSPLQGRLLQMLSMLHRAERILEIGTLGGYSTISLARALPANGQLVTLEINPHHAEVAARNIERAGFTQKIDIRVGPASATLAEMVTTRIAPFDFIFIDADKPSNPTYLSWSLQLSRPGTVIVIDNVVREGAVADPDSNDPNVHGVREMMRLIAQDPRLTATAIQTVGAKGYDGFCVAMVQQ